MVVLEELEHAKARGARTAFPFDATWSQDWFFAMKDAAPLTPFQPL